MGGPLSGPVVGVPGSVQAPTTAAPLIQHTNGNLTFSPDGAVVDPQRTEGEPLNFWDTAGNSDWESGPWGTTTQNSFVHRSTRRRARVSTSTAPNGLRPDPGPGGGDTDVAVDDQGYDYFVDLESLVNLGTSRLERQRQQLAEERRRRAGTIRRGPRWTPSTTPTACRTIRWAHCSANAAVGACACSWVTPEFRQRPQLAAAARACGEGRPFRLQADIAGPDLARSVQAAADADPADNSPRIPIQVRTLSRRRSRPGSAW